MCAKVSKVAMKSELISFDDHGFFQLPNIDENYFDMLGEFIVMFETP